METASESLQARIRLPLAEGEMAFQVTLPAGPISVRDMLPLAQNLANAVVGYAVQQSEAQGKAISCKKGCGACCRQLVPISAAEAREIRDLVDRLPEPRRSQVRDRFAQAKLSLQETGFWQTLTEREHWSVEQSLKVGLDYFRLGIPCPFLEEESCSIHPDRPVSCREYLVTSPAATCASPSRDNIDMVPLPLKVWTALARFDPIPPGSPFLRWVPLVMALDWTQDNPQEPESRPGKEVLEQFLSQLKVQTPEATPALPGQ